MKKPAILILPICLLVFTALSLAQTLAPGAPGKDAQWATAGKQGVGTSASLESKVWFTLAQGVMTEVYYPDVTVANVHLLQFVVVNPRTKKVETEQDDAVHEVKVLKSDSLSYRQINTAKSGNWRIIKDYTVDPENNSILIKLYVLSKKKDFELYCYFDPSLENSGMHDTAISENNALISFDKNIAAALLGNVAFTEKTSPPVQLKIVNGFQGVNDGLTQLELKKDLVAFDKAENGNVVQFARVYSYNLVPKANVANDMGKFEYAWGGAEFALGFGKTTSEAYETAKISIKKGFYKCQSEYEKGWSDYVKAIPKIELKYQAQFNMAAMILKAHEDKINRGANIASLSVPWGGDKNANENTVGGYHLVWSRDLYQVATAFMALGDKAAAERALEFLFKVQQKPDGSFPQNSWLDGKPFWGSLQMDEVAFPLILAHELGKTDKETYEKHIKKSADFIAKTGPITPQERWEERSGYSPSTIAAEIAGLVCAAEIAKKNGDLESANRWLKTADDWQQNIEKWTVTTNGKYGDGSYYLRITQKGMPNAGDKIDLGNGAGVFDEREIVDAGFLELVRLGIKSPDDPLIVKSLKVIDDVIRVKTPNGDGFYRYNHDGYGEMDDGRRWNFDGKYTGKGRLWALLSGERGQYELGLHKLYLDGYNNRFTNQPKNVDSAKRIPPAKPSITFLTSAKSRLDSMAKFANEGLMIPEQIWDKAETPKNVDKQFVPELKFGEGTGSATPLAWSMAQFIRLAVNLQEGRNLDTPDVVYNRYVLGKKSVGENSVTISHPEELPINCGTFLSLNKNVDTSKSPLIYKGVALFIYKADANEVEIVGDFTNWKSQNLKMKEFSSLINPSDSNSDGKCWQIYFKPTARAEYKLIVDGKWITDPLNPNKIDNGVGGENSFFAMPDYKPTIWDKPEAFFIEGIGQDGKSYFETRPEVQTVDIHSKIYGKRIIQVYDPKSVPTAVTDGLTRPEESSENISNTSESKLQPPVTEGGTDLPTLYLLDGTDYSNRAKAIQIQQNLVKAGKIKPFIIVFLDPKDRMKEYWANDDYAKFVSEEIVPAIDSKYKTIKSRVGRAIMGASLGGITSIHTAIKYPEIFGRVGGQSSSFWVDDERVVKELETLDGSKNKVTFYLDDGIFEGVEDSRKVVKILKNKGFPVTYLEGETGHNWTAWRDRLADAFVALWK